MKKIVLFFLSAFTLMVFLTKTSAQAPLAKASAATIMSEWKDSLSLAGHHARWSYEQGVYLKGMMDLWYQSGDPVYFHYVQKGIDQLVDDSGNIRSYKPSEYELDNLLGGRILLRLAMVTRKPKYLLAAEKLFDQLRTQPRTAQGGFWHKKKYSQQMWLDGLYMEAPFYTEYANLFHLDSAYNDIAKQFELVNRYMRDPLTGLYFHGWDADRKEKWANSRTGLSSCFWGRAMGWYGMALIDVLENYPDTNPNKDSLKSILKGYVRAVSHYQDSTSGLWWNIVDRGRENGNYLEASASSMFVYVLAKAARLGYVSDYYGKLAQTGYQGLLHNFVNITVDTLMHLEGTVSVSGLGGKPYRDGSFEYYASEPVVRDDPKGLGAFLIASVEMDKMGRSRLGKNMTVLLDDYYNSERHMGINGLQEPFHYKWEEYDNDGFSILGSVFGQYGVKTRTLSDRPTVSGLSGSDIYLIVDPDIAQENPHPNYMNAEDAEVIYNWVKQGGILIMLHNDKGNCEFEKYNLLSDKFGIHFNEDSYNRVTGRQFEMGAIDVPKGNSILPHENKIYQKEICSMTLKAPAEAYLKKQDLVIFAVSHVGKGLVFATGDPWLYNEYTDGRKLPLEYQNFNAAVDFVGWIVRQKLNEDKH